MDAISINSISKDFADVKALTDVSLNVRQGEIFGLIGEDGAGKTTLMRILTTLEPSTRGRCEVMGYDVTTQRRKIRDIIGFMPATFSLYRDLTVEENVSFFAQLFHTTIQEGYELIEPIYSQIEPFRKRLAGKLSGGMKQKLALCCALVHRPKILFLDEPTTGIDAVSRKELWDMLEVLCREHGMTIVVSTPYRNEVMRCHRIALMSKGRVKAVGTPQDLMPAEEQALQARSLEADDRVIKVEGLTKRFGRFTAVDGISFSVHRGEIFGFLGANGAGKTTAIRILCGLLKPTEGNGTVAGCDIQTEGEKIKHRIGYMSQKFALFPDLTVRENLSLFCGIYGMSAIGLRKVVNKTLEDINLTKYAHTQMKDLPLGWQQRVAFATATIHSPEILFLDEPTGGVDPQTRRHFWQLICDYADRGTTVFVTTHYMDEAMYCDTVSVMVDGRIEAMGRPADLIRQHQASDMEDLFFRLTRNKIKD